MTNRSPNGLVGVSLTRLRPRGARLLAPVRQITTREGTFPSWADPASDRATKTIALDLVLGPHEARDVVAIVGPVAHATAWLFLPEGDDPAVLVLELALKDRGEILRRHRFGVVLERSG
ncbi:MAG: hypothetical protein ACREDO_02650 [Methyloceanibacter sp.]